MNGTYGTYFQKCEECIMIELPFQMTISNSNFTLFLTSFNYSQKGMFCLEK